MPVIEYLDNQSKKYFELPADKLIIFGREEHTDFQILNDSMISREHFGIEKDDSDNFLLIDLGASNGTFLNGNRLDNDTIILKDGDEIKAGSQIFKFYLEKPKQSANEIFTEVVKSVDQGKKGFKTLMSEIVGNVNKSPKRK